MASSPIRQTNHGSDVGEATQALGLSNMASSLYSYIPRESDIPLHLMISELPLLPLVALSTLLMPL